MSGYVWLLKQIIGVESETFLCPALAEHTVFVVSVRNGSQLTGVPWDLRLAGHTSATHTFLVPMNFGLQFLSKYILRLLAVRILT